MRVLRVLLIDDDPEVRTATEKILESARYSVTALPGFGKAMSTLRRFRGKAVVLSEVGADGGSGLAFLEEALAEYPFVPFIFVTRDPALDSVISALQKGAYDFLRKPVPEGILLHSVARSAERISLSLETERHEKEIRDKLRNSREQLAKTQDRCDFKGFLMSTVAHDFRSLLTVLDGYHQVIQDQCRECGEEIPTQHLSLARRSIGRLRSMAATLLDVEAAEKGLLRMSRGTVVIDDLVRECAEFYAPYAGQKAIDLEISGPLPGLKVTTDIDRLKQVLDNIIYNAVKFTPARGRIRIGAHADGPGSVNIVIEDTGVGIPEKVLGKMVEENGYLAKDDGSARLGLGFTISRRLLDALKGTISLESREGAGTKVCISLPLK